MEYVVYLLKRLDPNKRKTTNLNQEFIKLYELHFFARTHEIAVQRIKKDLKWKFLCKADPMLSRLKAVDSFKKKYNKLIKQVGELGFVISMNEPTERLKNKKLAIHQRIRAYSPDIGHDSRYGCWVDPFEFVSKTKRKTKTYEYY